MPDNKLDSIDELINAIERGSEVEIKLYGKPYLLESDENGRAFIGLCPDGEDWYYNSAAELVDNWISPIGKTLRESWRDIDIEMMN